MDKIEKAKKVFKNLQKDLKPFGLKVDFRILSILADVSIYNPNEENKNSMLMILHDLNLLDIWAEAQVEAIRKIFLK